jgi:hypothetical protein
MVFQRRKERAMTRGDAIQEFQNVKDLIRQDGKDWFDERDLEIIDMAIEALSEEKISRAELFNKLATVNAPMEANAYKAEVYRIINEM